MLFDIAPNGFQGDIADAADKVGPVPEDRLPIEIFEVLGETVSYSPGAGRFQVAYQYGDIQSRMDFDQKMDVICFTAEFNEPTSPICQVVGEGGFQVGQNFRGQDGAAVFSYQHYMQAKQINGMR